MNVADTEKCAFVLDGKELRFSYVKTI